MVSGNLHTSDVEALPTARPALILLSGLPGTGKTTFARDLAARHGFVHIESDAIRRALALQPLYSPAESARVFAIAHARVRQILAAGGRAVIDATNLAPGDRRAFLRIARDASAAMLAVRLTAPEATVRERLRAPREGHSQAGEAVYGRMLGRARPFSIPVLVVDSRYDMAPSVDLAARTVLEGGTDAE